MTPLRAKMIRDMELQRLAPRTQEAYVAAGAGIASVYHCAPARRSSAQIRAYLHHLLVERHLAWRSCNQVACGLKFFDTRTLGWTTVHLALPPRTGRPPLPRVLSLEERERLCTSARNLTHRALRMTTSAAGRRGSEVVRLQLTDLESDRMLLRVNQGKGHKDRYTLLSPRLLSALRTSWKRYRPSPWLFPAQTPTTPMAIATAQKIYYHTQRAAGITHGKGIHTLRHSFAPHLLEAGVDVRTIQLLLGHKALDTTPRSLHITRQHLAQIRSPFDLLSCGDRALPSVE